MNSRSTFPLFVLVAATLSLTVAAAQEPGDRYGRGTTNTRTAAVELPRPRVVRATLRSAPVPADQWSRFIQHVRDGEAVPSDLTDGPLRPSNHQIAVRHFEAAARCGPVCAEALLARTVATPHAERRWRMLLGFYEAWNSTLIRSERVEALLLALLESREPPFLRSTAAEMLGTVACATRSPHAIEGFVDYILECWPSRAVLGAAPDSVGGCPGAPRLRPQAGVRDLIRTAAMTGDNRIVDRLLKREEAHPGPGYVRYVLDCLQLAAPHVDEPTARRLHDLFVVRPENLGPIGAQLTETQRAVLVLIAKLYPRLPEDLLPSIEPLFANETSNAMLRKFTRSRLR